MAKKRNGGTRAKDSRFFGAVNAFTAFIYSFFTGSRSGRRILRDDSFYKHSKTAEIFEKEARSATGKRATGYLARFLEQSVALRAASSFRSFMASLCLNVYGIFAVVYGLVSIVMYYLFYALNGKSGNGVSALITAMILIVCAIPMLVGNRSAVTLLSESVIMRRVLLSFFGLPVEKLKAGKSVGGTEFMFMSAILGLFFGIFTYFLHTAYFLIVLGVLILISLISVQPEAGVVLTAAAVPFLQYSDSADVILALLIVITMIAYVSKLIKHRRTVYFSAECVLVFIFCGFILVSGAFSVGGRETLKESLLTILVILGGFFMTYSLMETEKRLSSCLRFLIVSFISICLAGIWNLFYNGIADGVIYSMRESVRPIFANNIIYIADGASVFGVFAVLIFPLLLAFLAKKRSFTGKVTGLLLLAIAVFSVFVYGTYEAMVAIIIELCLFWLLYSHKSLTVLIFAAIPVVILVLGYPYLAMRYHLPDVGEVIKALLPLSFEDSSSYTGVVESSLEMLKDGNLLGIGAGKHAFEAVYPAYADAVSAGATNPGMLWLQLICWSGIGGTLTFILFAALLCRGAVGSIAYSADRKMRAETLALFCGVIVAMLFGWVSCIWDDVRMLYLFWAFCGFLAAYVREDKEKEERKYAVFAAEVDNTDIELKF